MSEEVRVVGRTAIVEAAHSLGVTWQSVCIHVSLQSFP